MSDDLISQLISEIVATKPGILGSQLGAEVKKVFPNFTGLKAFTEKHCSNSVICLKHPGGDQVYFTKNNEAEEQTSTQSSAVPLAGVATILQSDIHHRQPTFWQAFTNPSKPQCLMVNAITSSLGVENLVENVRPPWSVISKVSEDEHFKIASDFAMTLDVLIRPKFEKVLEANNWWHAWTKNFDEVGDRTLENNWLDFRTDSLIQLFEQRLSSLNISLQTATDLKAQLLQSKRAKVAQTMGYSHGSFQSRAIRKSLEPTAIRDAVKSAIDGNDLRTLVLAVVAQLSNDELRRIWLPLGVTLDEFRQHR